MDIEEIRKNVRGILGLEPVKEAEDEEVDDPDGEDADLDSAADVDISDDTGEEEEPIDIGDGENEDAPEDEESTGDDIDVDSSDEDILSDEPAQSDSRSDAEKVEQMFSDTGDPHVDYSLSNENNQRLAKFRFTYAGINVDNLMTDSERTQGVSAEELYNRLAPDQQEQSIRKWNKLRNKFPEISIRERMILIHNSNMMLLKNNEEGMEVQIPENLRKKAYEKVDAMMVKRYGDSWQDKSEAIDFLTSIKVNFDENNPVKPNLLSLSSFVNIREANKMPFNKMYVDTPSSVKTFLRSNQENDLFNKSPIFQSLISDYRESDVSTGTLTPIIKGTPPKIEEEPTDGETDESEGGGGSGGLGGGSGGTDVDVDVDTAGDDDALDIGPGGDIDDMDDDESEVDVDIDDGIEL